MQIYISKEAQRFGPYPLDIVNACLANGTFQPGDLAWYEGAPNWVPLASVPGVVLIPIPHPISGTGGNLSMVPALLLAGRGRRLGASLLDTLIGSVCTIPGAYMVIVAYPNDNQGLILGFVVILAAILVFACIQLYLLTIRGQTLGKRMLGIKIVMVEDETVPSFFKMQVMRSFLPGLIASIPYLGWIFWIVDCCFIFRNDRCCIHDLMAGTKVVMA